MRSLPAILLVLLAACGDDTPDPQGGGAAPAPIPETCAVASIDVRKARVPRPMPGVYFGQEIWLSYHDEAFEGQGYRYPRTRDKALALARDLCRKVHAGADIGELARQWSNAAGGRARGVCAVPLPANREAPDARDVALFRTPVGGITPLLEWRGGFWFAKRVSDAVGRGLGRKLEAAAKVRARARIIHIHHAGAYPRKFEFDNHPQSKAIETARWIIHEVRARGVSFEVLAEKWSNVPSRHQGGLMTSSDPLTGASTEWIRWGDRKYPQQVLDVLLEKGTPGEVWPEPIVSGRGVDVVLLLERRSD